MRHTTGSDVTLTRRALSDGVCHSVAGAVVGAVTCIHSPSEATPTGIESMLPKYDRKITDAPLWEDRRAYIVRL